MLTRDNTILQKATDAKINTEKATEEEQIKIEVIGSYETNGVLIAQRVKDNINNHIADANASATQSEGGEVFQIAERARCVGTDPIDSEDINETTFTYNSRFWTTKDYGIDKKLKVSDENYKKDYNQMTSLGIGNIEKEYWLASRYAWPGQQGATFCVRFINNSGIWNNEQMWVLNIMSSKITSYPNSKGFRPVFCLSKDAKIIGGEGTKDLPYELGI